MRFLIKFFKYINPIEILGKKGLQSEAKTEILTSKQNKEDINMGKNLLTVKDLTVNVEEKEILHGVNLTIGKGETHVLLGPNGTGKSTLGNTLLGNPKYNVTRGEIWFQGKNITEEPVNERAKMGLFLSFQNPLEVPGVTLSSFIRSAVELKTGKRMRLFEFRKELEKAMEVLQMDPSYADRDLNVGFSGGEKKKARSCSF